MWRFVTWKQAVWIISKLWKPSKLWLIPLKLAENLELSIVLNKVVTTRNSFLRKWLGKTWLFTISLPPPACGTWIEICRLWKWIQTITKITHQFGDYFWKFETNKDLQGFQINKIISSTYQIATEKPGNNYSKLSFLGHFPVTCVWDVTVCFACMHRVWGPGSSRCEPRADGIFWVDFKPLENHHTFG